jgi:hypothetical protein
VGKGEAHLRGEVGFGYMGDLLRAAGCLARYHDYRAREASILNGTRQISVRRDGAGICARYRGLLV